MTHKQVASILACASLLSGCYHTNYTGWRMQRSLPFAEIVASGQPCYVTDHGIAVKAAGGTCPPQERVELETARLLDWEGLPPSTFAGMTVVFSASRPACQKLGGCWGTTDVCCTAVVHYYDWPRVLQHELFHTLLQQENGDSDGAHFDIRWRWYRLMAGDP